MRELVGRGREPGELVQIVLVVGLNQLGAERGLETDLRQANWLGPLA